MLSHTHSRSSSAMAAAAAPGPGEGRDRASAHPRRSGALRRLSGFYGNRCVTTPAPRVRETIRANLLQGRVGLQISIPPPGGKDLSKE